MSNTLIEKNKEIEVLKINRPSGRYKDFDVMSDKALETFIETRLKPFLKLNNATT